MVVMLSITTVAPAMAQGSVQVANLEALEHAFWRCDHAATHGALDGATASQCSVVTEAFKARRFGGNFAAMLAWWQSNRDAQYLALAAEAKRLASSSTR